MLKHFARVGKEEFMEVITKHYHSKVEVYEGLEKIYYSSMEFIGGVDYLYICVKETGEIIGVIDITHDIYHISRPYVVEK